jgi:hypothetical protein
MIVKPDSNVKLDKLDSRLLDKLEQLDKLHRYITNHELVITSTNDDRHWGSTPKPKDWRTWSEDAVRLVSNSKHYTNEALDFRSWYLGTISKKRKDMFMAGFAGLFPKREYDLVFEKDHYHLEIDIKPILEIPDIRQPKDYPIKPNLKEIDPIELQKPDTEVGFFERIDWGNMPKALLNGVFRYFTKFNLFLTANMPSWMDKLIKLLKTLINKLTKKGN